MSEQRRCRLWWVWAVLPGVLATAGPARAFYWDGWPGSKVTPPQTITPTFVEGNPTKPPPNPKADPSYPPAGDFPKPTPGGPEDPPTPEQVPEPATGIVGLIGLAAVAAARWVRRKTER